MKLYEVDLEQFGIARQWRLGPFSPGLNFIVGPAASGKSTARNFVRGTLYGFDDDSLQSYIRAAGTPGTLHVTRGGWHTGNRWALARRVDERDRALCRRTPLVRRWHNRTRLPTETDRQYPRAWTTRRILPSTVIRLRIAVPRLVASCTRSAPACRYPQDAGHKSVATRTTTGKLANKTCRPAWPACGTSWIR